MKKGERKRFADLMRSLGEAYSKEISEPKIEIFWQGLQDLSFDQIHQNALQHLRGKGAVLLAQQASRFFPTIADLRAEGEQEEVAKAEAQEAYYAIKRAMETFFDPMLGQASLNAIQEHLRAEGYSEYVSTQLLLQWGDEILAERNPTATRPQFIRAYLDCKARELKKLPPRGGEPKRIGDIMAEENKEILPS